MKIEKDKLYTTGCFGRFCRVLDIVEGAIILRWNDREKDSVWQERTFMQRMKPYKEAV